MKNLVLTFMSLVMVTALFAAGTIRYVPGSYPTIQDAVNASVPGDIIQVAAGNFVQSVTVGINDLTIQGAGAGTVVKTIGATPALTVSADGFILKNLTITNNRQTKEAIRVILPASQGLTVDGVRITNLGNDADNAYGVNVRCAMRDVTVTNCQFTATLASSRAIAIYAPREVTQANWVIGNNQFIYVYVGIYINSSVSGLEVAGNAFGPWDLADCKQAASGLYIGDGGTGFNIDDVEVHGNTFTNYARGVYFLNNSAGNAINTTSITDNTFTNSIWSSGIRLVAGTDAFGTFAPAFLMGPITVSGNDFIQSAKIVNGSGVAMIDFRAVTGGESPVSMITVTGNNFTFNGPFDVATWGVLLRGPIRNADITGNIFAGNGAGGTSPNMPSTSAITLQTNYSDYGPMSASAGINILNNSISGFVNGISLYDMVAKSYGALPYGAKVEVHNNAITGNTMGIYSGIGERTNARNNWWGNSSGPFHSTNLTGTGDPVTDYVEFLPWWCDAGMTTVCPQATPGNAILNVNTNTWYSATSLGTAFNQALHGHTLYIAGGQVNSAVYNYPGKTVHVIGNGKAGESTVCCSGRALTIDGGNLTLDNGLRLYGKLAKTLYITGGTLKVRNCMLAEDSTQYHSILGIEGGSVDAGTVADKGKNLFLVNGTGAALDNIPLAPVSAIGNDWGSTKGPLIVSNPGGNGGEIIGAGKDFVQYDPWRGGPVTVASHAKVCQGGTTALLPVKVASFTQVGSLSLQMTYDVTKLANPTLAYQDPAFADWGNLQINTSVPGIIDISGLVAWPYNGITLADSTTLFTLGFDLLPGTTTTVVQFSENASGTSCRYTGSTPLFMEFGDRPQATHYINGSVTYDPNPPVTAGVGIGISENPVAPGMQVTFTATPVNGGANPVYQWKVDGVTMGSNSATFTYYPSNGDEVKVLMTSAEQCVTGSPATSNTITVWVIDENLNVTGTVNSSENNCYNAGKVITVAGLPETFVVKAGASVTMIAGQKISYLPGTTVELNGYLHGYISPSGPFCPPALMATQPLGGSENQPLADANIQYKVYPNPTSGEFTLTRYDNDAFFGVTMTIYNMRGDRVLTKTLDEQAVYKFNIGGQAAGFYFIRLVGVDHTETIKLIKVR